MYQQVLKRWLSRQPADRAIANVPPGSAFAWLATDTGTKRSENQDRSAALRVTFGLSSQSFFCAAICDGMGGMPNGTESAVVALAEFMAALIENRAYSPTDRLKRAVHASNLAVYRLGAGGGATLSAVLLQGGRLFTANIGDSRIYGLRRSANDIPTVTRLTRDDTLRDAFGGQEDGLLQFVGMGSGITPHVSFVDQDFDTLLISTDGVHRIGEDMIESLFGATNSTAIFLRRIVELARWTGGIDNATAIALNARQSLVAVEDEEPEVVLWTPEGELQIPLRPITFAQPSTIAAIAPNPSDSPEPASPSPMESDNPPAAERKKARKSGSKSPLKKKVAKDVESDPQIEIGFKDLSAGDND